jgi:hypothetical protein
VDEPQGGVALRFRMYAYIPGAAAVITHVDAEGEDCLP